MVVIRIAPREPGPKFDYTGFQRAQDVVSERRRQLIRTCRCCRKDLEELVLIMKGNTPEYLLEARDVLLDRIQAQVNQSTCQLIVGVGEPRGRITDLGQSFLEALAAVENAARAARRVSRLAV